MKGDAGARAFSNTSTAANRRFRDVLRKKGYAMELVERREGHNWNNWRPLVDDVLRYFYSPETG